MAAAPAPVPAPAPAPAPTLPGGGERAPSPAPLHGLTLGSAGRERLLTRALPLAPNTNRKKKRQLKSPYKFYGIAPAVNSNKFIMPRDAPKDPFVSAFNQVLLKLYNQTADIHDLLKDVSETDTKSHLFKKNVRTVLKGQISDLRRQGYKLRVFIINLGAAPINEPTTWTRS